MLLVDWGMLKPFFFSYSVHFFLLGFSSLHFILPLFLVKYQMGDLVIKWIHLTKTFDLQG